MTRDFKTYKDAEKFLKCICKGEDIRVIPLNYILKSTIYYISDIGEVFSCRKLNSHYKISSISLLNKDSKGFKVGIYVSKNIRKIFRIENIIYWTFKLGYCDTSIQIGFKDGNVYNYNLVNLYIKDNEIKEYRNNIYRYSKLYDKEFWNVCCKVKSYSKNYNYEDCQDAVSNTFLEICNRHVAKDYSAKDFMGNWINTAKLRLLDRYRSIKNLNSLSKREYSIGEFDKSIDVTDIWECLKEGKAKTYLRMWCDGMSVSDIANEFNCKPTTISCSISHTCQKIKKYHLKEIQMFV